MGKRTPKDENPFRPLLNTALISESRSEDSPKMEARRTQKPVAQLNRTLSSIRTPAPEYQPVDYRDDIGRFSLAPEKIDQEKRMLLTRKESVALDRVVSMIARRLNAQIKLSHVLRALTFLLLSAESDLDRRAGEVGTLIRPPNGDANGIKEFDRQIARMIARALNDAAPKFDAHL